MKLVHPDCSMQIIKDNDTVCEWVIESPEFFSKYIQELIRQNEGKEGKFVLSDEKGEVELSHYSEIIFNIISLDINEKKILNKMYAELEELAYQEEFFLQTQNMTQKLQAYILELEQATNYILEFKEQPDLTAIFKAAGLKYEIVEEDILERLVRYIKTSINVMKTKLFVFINLRSFLSEAQMEQLIRELSYQEVKVLLIENQAKCCMEGVRRYIIDKDGCEI